MNTSKDYEQYQYLRDALQLQVNASVIKPISAEIFKKSDVEKLQLKDAKDRFKLYKKSRVTYNREKDELLRLLASSTIPNWGGVALKVTKSE